MDTLLISLSKKRNLLSQLEKEVLDFMIKNPELIVNLKVNELADSLYVSTATISRTAKKLGFLGYQELKYKLSLHLESSLKNNHNDSSYPLKQEIIRTINNSLSLINQNKIKLLKQIVTNKQKIEIFAVGASYPIGLDLSKKLLHLGYYNNIKTDWDDMEIISNNLDKDDLAIFISQSGETLQLINYANNIKRTDTMIISIIANHNSPLEKLSDLFILGETIPYYHESVDLSSRIGLLSITELIAIEISK